MCCKLLCLWYVLTSGVEGKRYNAILGKCGMYGCWSGGLMLWGTLLRNTAQAATGVWEVAAW
eukprot:6491544-Amphidinium_carterae.3